MDKDTRNILFNTIQAIRRGLEEEFRLQLEGTFDVHDDGRIEEQAGAPLTDRQKLTRRKIIQAVEHRRAMGEKAGESVKGFIREAAFTFLNRLAALKMMEARGIVQECVSTCGWRDGKADTEAVFEPRGFKEFSGLAPGLVELPDKGYRLYLECLFDEVGREVGVLFDRTDSASLLWPRRKALADALTLLNAPGLDGIWSEDETIGWIYQYYNDPAERRQMRDESAAPRNSREMAVRNQFFTPRYVVEFLTDNSLGRLWYEMTKGRTRLKDQCQYLIRRQVEWFLPDPNTVFWHDSPGQAEFRRFCETASPHDLPADPSLGMLLGWVSHVKRLGFEEDLRIIGLTHQQVVDEILTPLEQGRPSERLDSSHPIELMQVLWRLAHELDKHGYGRPVEPVSADPVAGPIWSRLREHFLNPPSDLSKEEALKLPAFIPHRPIKDPRQIRMLDPACGSMHFGLYTFDLFLTIYEEAWQWGLIAKAGFGFPQPPFPHASVRLRAGSSQVHSNDLHGDIPAATARVVVLAQNDAGDGLWTRGPYLAPPEQKYRPAIVWETPLKDFHYPQALAEGRFTAEDGEHFVRQTRCWDHDRADGSTDEEIEHRFARQIPALIVEHNIHGIDIDPRAAQMAGLAMWLRAQRHWQSMGLKAVDRPTIRRSNIVCAEPMPGEKELLGAFVRESFRASEQPFFQRLLESVFEKMQIAGEAGALLQIEEEIRSLVHEARDAWRQLGKRSGELFSEAELARSDLRAGTQLKLDLGSWSLDALSGIPDAEFWEQAEERIYEALRVFSEKADSTGFQRRLFAEDAARGFAFIDVCRKRYDVALMNPPFGEATASLKFLMQLKFELSKYDLGATFLDCVSSMLTPTGCVGLLSNRTIYFLSRLSAFRKHALNTFGISCFADLGSGVLDAMVEAAAACFAKPASTGQAVFSRNTQDDDKGAALLENLREANSTNVFITRTAALAESDTCEFCYWIPQAIQVLRGTPQTLGHAGVEVRQGIATGDNFRFLRLLWEIPAGELFQLWHPYAKGGDYSPLFYSIHLCVVWGSKWRDFFNGNTTVFSCLVTRNSEKYLNRPGLTYPTRTSSRFAPRMMPAGTIFDTKGSAIFHPTIMTIGDDSKPLIALAALLNTALAQCIVDTYVGAAEDSSRSYGEGVIARLPFTPALIDTAATHEKFGRLITKLFAIARRDERAQYFVASFSGVGTLREQCDQCVRSCKETSAEYNRFFQECDSMVSEKLNLDKPSREFIANEVARYPSLTPDCLTCPDHRSFIEQIVAELLGVAFGRWDIRYAKGEQTAPELPDPFAPLPVCPPGQLQNAQGLPARPEDVPAAYPVRIPWDGILVDDPNHPLDIERRVREVIEIIWNDQEGGPTAEAIEHEACEILGVKSLRDYFRKPAGFFADHLKRYSKSRRQAPIYWPLSSPKNLYSVWLYYHRLTPDTLFSVLRDHVKPKLEYEERRAFQFRQEAGPTPSPSQRQDIAEADELVEDLRAFRDELNRVAPLFRPNPNDGVIINHAPLWRLAALPKWREDCRATWDELARGDYDWAHLAFYLWPERVIPKCATDRSLAIAHGLEDTFWEITPEDELPKKQQGKGTIVWRSKKVSSADLETLITTHTSPAIKAALEELAKAPVAGGGKKGRKSAK